MHKRLLSTLLIALAFLLAACADDTPQQQAVPQSTESAAESTEGTETSASTDDVVAPSGYIEPPFLADRVAAGELPPIQERLPAEPFVVGPGVLIQEEYMTWQNGQYGGDLNVAATFPSGLVYIGFGATILRSPSQTTEASRPNIMSEFSYSEDFTTFHFKIREGLKWSDGMPVTTEDVRFVFEDVYLDPDVQRPFPSELFARGNSELGPAQLKVIDDLTFELTFSEPYGFFVAPLNSWIPGYDILIKPSHYLKQFHAKYADEAALAGLVEEHNVADWVELLTLKDISHWGVGENNALGLPTLNAWVMTEAGEQRRVFERNPFYWHVDSDGRQLPYTDRLVVSIVVDHAAQSNAILAGQVNIASAEDIALSEMPLYVQNADRAGIRAFTTGSFNWPILLFLNHDYQFEDQNSTWQQLVSDPEQRFGRAIAAAINTDDINKSVYFDLFGDPVLHANEYDPAIAAQLLDEAGMDEMQDGFRLGPDGEEFIFRITNNNGQADFPPVLELLKEQLEAVGIRTEIDNVAPSLFDQRKTANDIMASILWNDGPAWFSGISEDYLPNHKGPWSPMTWQYFISNGEQGREPPEYLQAFYDLHSARKGFPPQSAEGEELFQQMMQWFEETYVMIPTAGAKVSANVVGTQLRNIPNEGAPFNLDTYINAEGVWIEQ